MPYTKIVLGSCAQRTRFYLRQYRFGSLLYYLGDDLNTGKDRGRIEEDLTVEAWNFYSFISGS